MFDIFCHCMLIDKKLIDSVSFSWFLTAFSACMMRFDTHKCFWAVWILMQKSHHESSWLENDQENSIMILNYDKWQIFFCNFNQHLKKKIERKKLNNSYIHNFLFSFLM